MGGGASTAQRQQQLGKSQKAIVELMMPLYYDSVDITPEQHKMAVDAWDLVLKDKTPEFLARKGKEDFPYLSCVTFFFDTYYCRLFDVHPAAKELFKHGMKGQGKFLVLMISLSLSEMEKPVQYDKTLIKLAEGHYKKGVKAVEYGIVGEVLMWSLHKVMGDAYYTEAVHRVWIKIYSRMLRTIIPIAVACELKGPAPDGSEDGVTRRVGGIFENQLQASPDDNLALKCQAVVDNQRETSVHVRPAARVSAK